MRHSKAARSNSEACVSCEARDRSEAHTKAVKEVEARYTVRRCACHSVRLCFDGLCGGCWYYLTGKAMPCVARSKLHTHSYTHVHFCLLFPTRVGHILRIFFRSLECSHILLNTPHVVC